MNPSDNPFAVLTLIGAPAVLTNACSVLVMSTSNRLGRTLDRARVLAKELEIHEIDALDALKDTDPDTPVELLKLHELRAAEQRTVLLVRALQLFYVALSGFAASAFVSILGAILLPRAPGPVVTVTEAAAVTFGFAAVAAVVSGAILLVRETRIAVTILHEQARHIGERVERRLRSG